MSSCHICPRECGVDRTRQAGFCGCSDVMHVSKTMLHRWEEPCISGTDKDRGSGAVFFSGCSLKCVFCQNKDISRTESGKTVTPAELGKIMLELQNEGAYNINFVSPTHYTTEIMKAIDSCRESLRVPTVWNTGGYEKPETVRMLAGYADIFLTDFKYASPEKAKIYASASDYPEYALASLREMVKLAGKPKFDKNGMLESGVIVRHLVLPGERSGSIKLISLLKDNFDKDDFLISVMRQYTPDFYSGEIKSLRRKVTSFEYKSVLDAVADAGFDGYSQDACSAAAAYTPDFR